MKEREYTQLATLLRRAGFLKEKGQLQESPLPQLSLRELQILVAIASGTAPAQASRTLGINTKTFSTYRYRVLEKLHLTSNAELAVLAYELGMVPSVLAKLKENEDVELGRPAANQSTDD